MKTLIVCLIVYWTCATKSVTGSVEGFHSFEDYLRHVTSDAERTHNVDYIDDHNDTTTDGVTSTSTSNELLNYFRTIPRDHWSCCMLGLLAGSKGFQCQSQYYSRSADMTRRNVNRAQTARQPAVHGARRELNAPRWGYAISRSFERCVGGSGVRSTSEEFHKCCYAAAEERRQLRRARRYRRRHPAASRRQTRYD